MGVLAGLLAVASAVPAPPYYSRGVGRQKLRRRLMWPAETGPAPPRQDWIPDADNDPNDASQSAVNGNQNSVNNSTEKNIHGLSPDEFSKLKRQPANSTTKRSLARNLSDWNTRMRNIVEQAKKDKRQE